MPITEVPPDERLALAERLRITTETLERIAADRATLALLSEAERTRLRQAVAEVYNPDARARRSMVKAIVRRRKHERVQRDDVVLAETGIRTLRRQPVFTTPNVFPPKAFVPHDVPPSADDETEALATHQVLQIGDTARGDAARGDSTRVDASADIGADTGADAGASARAGAATEPASEPLRAPDAPVLRITNPRNCYICKRPYTTVHHFYDRLCPACGELNFAKRTELADLRGRVALLTGGRVKIGYQAGLKLLRAGAHLIVTTRFPRDSAARYAREPDFSAWGHRLEIFGLDLRHTPSVEAFCRGLAATHDRLDFVINNACQTVRRPPEFYAHMMASELAAPETMSADARRLLGSFDTDAEQADAEARAAEAATNAAGALQLASMPGVVNAPALSQVRLLPEEMIAQHHLFPDGQLDQDLQQVDLRGGNSWRMLLADVSAVELLEVQLVNAVAPFILNARLKPLMLRTPDRDKHVVNVSAVEGQFYRSWKTTRHPHTNMAKAALNMMTRTAAADYHADGIHMNSVDTGWVTDEDAAEIAARKTREQFFHPPLDIVDGAARIVDPIITGINTGQHIWGKFLKDYRPTDW